jgi:hypothetical protein
MGATWRQAGHIHGCGSPCMHIERNNSKLQRDRRTDARNFNHHGTTAGNRVFSFATSHNFLHFFFLLTMTMNMKLTAALLIVLLGTTATAFTASPLVTTTRQQYGLKMTDQIVSPFDSSEDGRVATYTPTEASELNQDEILELTEANVELVLDEMRPYLIQDGGNVAIAEIDGPVVRLELQVCNENVNHPYNNNNEQCMLNTLGYCDIGRMRDMSFVDANYENGTRTTTPRTHSRNSRSDSEHAGRTSTQ